MEAWTRPASRRIFRVLSLALVPGAIWLHAATPAHAQAAAAPVSNIGARIAPRQGAVSSVAAIPVGWSKGPALPPAYTGNWDVSYAEFPPLGQIVTFGGSPKAPGEVWSNTTWVLANGAWTRGPEAPSGLSPRGGTAMAFDPDINKIVLFGGGGPEWPPRSDTWLYDAAGWTPGPVTPAGLLGRVGARLAYDPVIHRLVLFGGSGTGLSTDTWLYDGTGWTQGPSAPAGMKPRVFFGMTYVASQHKIFIAGGDGDTDTWWFDGSTWSPGPSLAGVGPKERVGAADDYQLGGPVIFGGLGPGSATAAMYWLQGTSWRQVPHAKGTAWPSGRLDGWMIFDPATDALVYGGGVDDVDGGISTYNDIHYFREVSPSATGIVLAPANPGVNDPISVSYTVAGGYKTVNPTFRWTINAVVVPGATTRTLTPNTGGFDSGDSIQAQVMLTDSLGKTSGWQPSASVTVGDRPPSINACSIDPTIGYVTSTLTASCSGVKDPDGDPVTLHYAWQVNASPVGTDSPSLPNTAFTANDSVSATVTPVDNFGLAGPALTTPSEVIRWNIAVTSPAFPGGLLPLHGGGYAANEQVDLRLDSATAPIVTTIRADANGVLLFTNVLMPIPLAGGQHMVFGVGRTSATLGRGPATIVPVAAIAPKLLAAGDATAFNGDGYVPGETVRISFPGGTPLTRTAAANGTVSATLASPPEPFPGDNVTGTAPSGSASDSYKTFPTFTAPAAAEPQDVVAVQLTGYQAGETVGVAFDGAGVAATYTADATGSVNANLTMNMLFGTGHLMTATGVTSLVSKIAKVDLPAWLVLSPDRGVVGTNVTLDSGPGWSPAESLQVIWGSSVLKTVTADATGTVHTTFVVPQHAAGAVTVKLKEVTPIVSATPTTTFTITASLIVSTPLVPPGTHMGVQSSGFMAGEQVTFCLDSPTGLAMATLTADATGAVPFSNVPAPAPLAGGSHVVVAVGMTSGTQAWDGFTVIPTASLSLKTLASGDPTVFTGMGYVPGETVSVSFPGGSVQTQVADAAGSVTVDLVSPPEPNPGGNVTGAAPSASAVAGYTTTAIFTVPSSAQPGDSVPVLMTGFGAGEQVGVSFDSGPVVATYTADGNGTVSDTLTLTTYFGLQHVVHATGATSAVTKMAKVDLPATMALSPTSGPVTTTITVTSGPGWAPGESFQVLWGSTVLKTVTADGTGQVRTTIQPLPRATGECVVKLKEVTTIVGRTLTANFTVTTS